MGAAERRRGARAEVQVVNHLRVNGWPDARRYLAGDGRQPGDIDVWPGIALEVKDRAQSAWPTWRQQALTEAGPTRIPIVIRRERGDPDVGRWHTEITTLGWIALGGNPLIESFTCSRTETAWSLCQFHQIIHLLEEETRAA